MLTKESQCQPSWKMRAVSREQSAQQHILQTVQYRLRECPYAIVFSNVTADFELGRLTLQGTVPSYYMKQMLQEVLRSIEHVVRIYNEVNVLHTR